MSAKYRLRPHGTYDTWWAIQQLYFGCIWIRVVGYMTRSKAEETLKYLKENPQ